MEINVSVTSRIDGCLLLKLVQTFVPSSSLDTMENPQYFGVLEVCSWINATCESHVVDGESMTVANPLSDNVTDTSHFRKPQLSNYMGTAHKRQDKQNLKCHLLKVFWDFINLYLLKERTLRSHAQNPQRTRSNTMSMAWAQEFIIIIDPLFQPCSSLSRITVQQTPNPLAVGDSM